MQNHTETRVERARTSDLDRAAPLFDAYRQFYEQKSDPEGARAFLAERLDRNESVIFIATGSDDIDTGFTQLYPMFSSVRMKSIWVLNDLFVVPDARRMGVARALMHRACQWARARGAAGLELATAWDNVAAKRVYEDLGWTLDTEYDHYSIQVET